MRRSNAASDTFLQTIGDHEEGLVAVASVVLCLIQATSNLLTKGNKDIYTVWEELLREREGGREKNEMEGAEEELERRSKFLSSLISKKKATEQQEQRDRFNVRVRASDMPSALQSRAFRCARDGIDSMPGKLDSKTLALALKKEFDLAHGPAWHCIVGTSFGSYVTHSLGGFLYFSIDKVYILLFKTAVQPLEH